MPVVSTAGGGGSSRRGVVVMDRHSKDLFATTPKETRGALQGVAGLRNQPIEHVPAMKHNRWH